jgi:hypothetical protein
MKNDKIIPGLILVLIGAAFLLHNFGYIHFHWMNIIHLWPIFLIIGGVNLVFVNNRTPLATALKVGVVLLGFGLLLFGNFSNRWGFPVYSYSTHDHDNNDSDDNDDDDDSDTTGAKGIVKVEGTSNFILPYTTDAKFAQLHISGGGTKYDLSDTTAQLFNANTKEHFGKYEFTHFNTGSTYVLNFDMKDKKGSHFDWDSDDDKSNAVTFKLNPSPVWDINVETGATDLNFDLTPFKIRTLKLSGGAAKFQVKLGQPIGENTNVEVSTGMADVDINIPQSAACKIITDSGLSSNSFDGFTKTNDDNYETPGFDAAKSKIIINISGGISNFKVNRY